MIRVELGRVPWPWTTYARWAAVDVLASLILGTGVALWRHPARLQDGAT